MTQQSIETSPNMQALWGETIDFTSLPLRERNAFTGTCGTGEMEKILRLNQHVMNDMMPDVVNILLSESGVLLNDGNGLFYTNDQAMIGSGLSQTKIDKIVAFGIPTACNGNCDCD